MTYRELLDLYKRNELDLEQRIQVEADIEKQEAIGDFLYERDDIPSLTALLGEQEHSEETDSVGSQQEREFMKMINQSIRRAFVKMGIIASTTALIILFLIQFVLPQIVSAFYYDPGKEVAKDTNQMSLDMAVYTELMVPGYFRFNVRVDDLGYGKYDFCIIQNYSHNEVFTNVSGRIERGRMIKYDANALTVPTGNAFAHSVANDKTSRSMSELEAAGQVSIAAAGTSSENLSRLQALSDDSKYVAYITLERPMKYTPLINFIQKNSIMDAWCAVCTNWISETSNMPYPENIGFLYSYSTSHIKWDNERYPNLMLNDFDLTVDSNYDNKIKENLNSEDFMLTHFTSMLRYISDQKKFLKMMDLDSNMFTRAIDNVKENGLLIYGFEITANKKQLIELLNQDEVYLIFTQPLK